MKTIKMSGPKGRKTVQEAFAEFLKYCKVRNLSERTIKYYTEYMTLFQKYLDSKNVVVTTDISEMVVLDYVLALKESKAYKDVTINTCMRAVRAIVYYFQSRGYCSNFKIPLIAKVFCCRNERGCRGQYINCTNRTR